MQFNPTHPMALKYIRSIKREGPGRYVGRYEWDMVEYDFDFDIQDTRYRVHADVWLDIVRMKENRYQMFDLVSNHDILQELGVTSVVVGTALTEEGDFLFQRDLKPIFLDPCMTTREPRNGYSYMGPWPGEIMEGIGQEYIVPYFTRQFRRQEEMNYLDITALTKLSSLGLEIRNYCKGCFLEKKFESEWKCNCDSNTVLYRRYGNTGEYYVDKLAKKVYTSERVEGIESDFSFFKFPGKIGGYPTNGKETLIYDVGFSRLVPIFQAQRYVNFMEYLPMSIARVTQNTTIIEEESDDDMTVGLEGYYNRLSKGLTQEVIMIRRKPPEDVMVVLRGLQCDIEEDKTVRIKGRKKDLDRVRNILKYQSIPFEEIAVIT